MAELPGNTQTYVEQFLKELDAQVSKATAAAARGQAAPLDVAKLRRPLIDALKTVLDAAGRR